MKQKTKGILIVILLGTFFLVLTLMMFALAIKGYNNSNIDLSKVDFCKGSVIEKRIELKKGKINLNVFHFKINGTNENFASYNKNQNYTKLTNEIRIGDELNVYYKKTKNSGFNLDVIQIEQNGKIILPKKEYESQQNSLIYIGVIGGLTFLIILVKFIKTMYKKINTSANSSLQRWRLLGLI